MSPPRDAAGQLPVAAPVRPPVGARAIVCLGLSQLIGWGVTFYLIGALGPAITAGLGWNSAAVYGGFSAAIVTMALVSPIAGLAVDRWGGRRVMPAGAVLSALGCVALASAHALPHYYLAWVVLGAGMRLSLYDAAFASLARAAGPTARRPMSQITLFGGLASTVMWPVGHLLAEWLGWRGAVLAYGALALATAPLFLALPRQPRPRPSRRGGWRPGAQPGRAPAGRRLIRADRDADEFPGGGQRRPSDRHPDRPGAGGGGRGRGRALGVGQFSGRLVDVALGGRLHPLTMTLIVCLLLPLSFALALASDGDVAMLAVYALAYGACNGLLTIARGTLPLALFDYRSYGAVVGGC